MQKEYILFKKIAFSNKLAVDGKYYWDLVFNYIIFN